MQPETISGVGGGQGRAAALPISEFRSAVVTCERCGWSGEGGQTKLGLIYHRGMVSEFRCPRCGGAPSGHFLAVVPWPRKGERRE